MLRVYEYPDGVDDPNPPASLTLLIKDEDGEKQTKLYGFATYAELRDAINGVDKLEDWIAFLRSGEYEQTDGFLHDDEGYCCLGVYATMYGVNQRRIGFSNEAYRYEFEFPTPDSRPCPEDTNFPMDFLNMIGMSEALEGVMTQMNDNGGFTFAEIADLLDDKDIVVGAIHYEQ